MTEKRFLWLSMASLCAIVVLAFLGEFFQAVSLLFSILLAVAGIVGGYLTSSYFDKKAERQNLGKFASAGLRLSVDIYDSLGEVLEEIDNLTKSPDSEELSTRELHLLLNAIAGRISVLRRFSLSANNQWKDVLPPEQLLELKKRGRVIDLSEDWEVQITEEVHAIHQ